MRPILLHLGYLSIPSYGAMLALGVLLSSLLALFLAGRRGLDKSRLTDLISISVIAAVIGARALFALLNRTDYASAPLEVFMIWKGGLSFHGGLAAGIGAALFFMRRQKALLYEYMDIMAPCVALGYAITRVGCLLNGCCYGKPAPELPWAVDMGGVLCHPSQIYSSLLSLLLLPLLLLILKSRRYPGQVLLFYVILYSVERFCVEFFRAGESAMLLGNGLTQAQIASLFLIIAGLLTDMGMRRKKARPVRVDPLE